MYNLENFVSASFFFTMRYFISFYLWSIIWRFISLIFDDGTYYLYDKRK